MPTLTPSALTAIYYSAEKMYKDGQLKEDYTAEVNAALAVIDNTTVKIELKDEDDKPRTATVYWSKKPTSNLGDCTETPNNLCALTGNEADSAKKDYTVSECVTNSFTVDENLYQSNYLRAEDVMSNDLLLAMKEMDEAVSQKMIAKIDSFSSANLYTKVGIGCPADPSPLSWAQTYIQPQFWTPEIMGYFKQVARINKFSSPWLLDGDNLYNKLFQTEHNQANADGKGAFSMLRGMKYYEDLYNMPIVNPSDSKTFMINRGTTAFSSYAYWDKFGPENAQDHGSGQFKFSVKSKNIPGLTYDVYTLSVCSGRHMKHTWTLEGHYDLFNGPPANSGATGILEFICGACPA